ncbi:hypothetical protein WMF39_16705 [Sorangium sp. So ce1504]|uniref:hypothetical protein n=1 Tax=Sorangium sp. So ce1504 TaxID=3133337 RepID=UPI003F61AC85
MPVWYAGSMRMLLLALLPALPLLPACADAFGDREAPELGAALGAFHVVGTQTANTCGEGALGAKRLWEFDVELARGDGALYWNNGASVIAGVIDDDEVSFSIDGRVVVDMRAGDAPPGPPCSVERRDRALGQLGGRGDDVAGFKATMSFEFVPTAGSRCEDLVAGELSVAPVVAALPCGMAYDLKAKRSALPPE